MAVKEPERVKIEGKRGLHVVYKGEIIEGMGWDKNTKVYYAIGSKPRKWFRRDFSESYFLFNKWKNRGEKYTPITKPKHDKSLRSKAQITLTDEFAEVLNKKDINFTDLIEAIKIREAEIPESEIWKRARELIYTDQVEAARKLGIPEVAHLDKISPPPKSLPLKQIGENYLNKSLKPLSRQEKKDSTRWWTEFCNIVGVETIRDISEEHIRQYHEIITKMAPSAVFQRHRLRKIRTILFYALGESTYKNDLKRVIEYTDYFKGRYLELTPSNPTPIKRDNFFKIYNVADEQYKLMMLIAANCGFTEVDIAALEWSMIDLEKATLKMRREKRGHVLRIAVFWNRVIKQLRKLRRNNPDSEFVFLDGKGQPYTANAISCKWYKLREKAKVKRTKEEPNTLGSIRDRAQTEPAATCLNQNIDCLMGHACGISDRYKLRDPKKLVNKVCRVLENYYFPSESRS